MPSGKRACDWPACQNEQWALLLPPNDFLSSSAGGTGSSEWFVRALIKIQPTSKRVPP
jgi:hypothetical protein